MKLAPATERLVTKICSYRCTAWISALPFAVKMPYVDKENEESFRYNLSQMHLGS